MSVVAVDALLAIASFLTSIVSGVLGMAGGIALIGVMAAVMADAYVVPLHGAVQLVANGSRTLLLMKHAAWLEVLLFAGPLIIGTALSAWLGKGFDYKWLEPAIGVMLLLFIAWRRFQPRVVSPPLVLYPIVGLLVGSVMLFIGATGPLSAIVFKRDDWSPQRSVSSMALAQAIAHLLKLPAFLAIGFDYRPHLPLLALLCACALAGTWVGNRLLARMSPKVFGTLFDVALAVLAISLIVRAN